MNETISKTSNSSEYVNNLDPFIPQMGEIIDIRNMTEREKFFRVKLFKPLAHDPGQFVMASVLGIGEAPISITCGPRKDNILEMVIRKTGGLTQVFHSLTVGQSIGIRGPFGSGFDMEEMYGKDIIFVCGGLGLVPLRSLIIPVIEESKRFGSITLITGSRNPSEVLFPDDLKKWGEKDDIRVIRLVDRTDNQPWDGEVGLVTEPISGLDMDSAKTIAVLCGPPVMYKFVIMELNSHKLPYSQIYVDLERRMRCGIGKCGHCQINDITCCREGPVFRLSALGALPEALL